MSYDSKCYNNSINIYGSGSPVAINVSHNTNNADIKNNIFANHAGGYALYCRFSNSQILSADFNNLYSNGEYIANWLDVNIENLSEWQTASGFGGNSVSSNPDFVSNTDLHTSNVLLNNAGTPLPEVIDDIDGEPRDAVTPDIGADEFESVTFSIGDDVTVCVDDEYKIDAGEGFDSYLWSTGADSSYILVDSTGVGYGSHEYSVTVTLGGEPYSDAITVTFSSPIAVSQDYFCFDMFTDSVLVTAGDALYYLWSTGETTQSIWTSSTVSVTVTDANGCQDNATINRHWNSCPANLSMPADTTIYIGETLVLDANANCDANYDNYSYLWSTGETTETIAVSAAELGVGSYPYSVIVTNNSDSRICTTSDMVDVNVSDDTAVEDFSMEGISIYPNPTDGILKLEFSNTFEKVWIKIINATGQVVFSEYRGTLLGTKTLDLAGLEKGIYILSIKGENLILTNKIILY